MRPGRFRGVRRARRRARTRLPARAPRPAGPTEATLTAGLLAHGFKTSAAFPDESSGLCGRGAPPTVAGAAAAFDRVPFSPRERGTVTELRIQTNAGLQCPSSIRTARCVVLG